MSNQSVVLTTREKQITLNVVTHVYLSEDTLNSDGFKAECMILDFIMIIITLSIQ